METLIIPLVIILLPFLMLFLIIRYLNKRNGASLLLKITMGLVFMAIGIMTTYLGMTMAMNGLSEKGVRCMTGIAVFMPLGIANIVGIPLYSFFIKATQKIFRGNRWKSSVVFTLCHSTQSVED
jgi:hypothetical protein